MLGAITLITLSPFAAILFKMRAFTVFRLKPLIDLSATSFRAIAEELAVISATLRSNSSEKIIKSFYQTRLVCGYISLHFPKENQQRANGAEVIFCAVHIVIVLTLLCWWDKPKFPQYDGRRQF